MTANALPIEEMKRVEIVCPLQRRRQLGARVDGEGGSPVLLIMGFSMSGRAWVNQVGPLAGHHRVATYDHAGVGASDPPPLPCTMRSLAADALGLMDALGWRRAHVVGVSMGGMVAQELALAAPARLRSLTLIATHAGGGLRAMLPTWAGLAHFVAANVGGRARRLAHLERLLFPPAWLATADADGLAALLAHDFHDPAPMATRRAQLGAIRGHDTRERLGALAEMPTLIVRPGQDLLVRPDRGDTLARALPHARVLRLDDAGHGAIRQCKDELNEALLGHFATADVGILPDG